MAKIIEYIITDEYRGEGTEKNPGRRVTQLWTKEGILIAEHDPCPETGGIHEPRSWFNLASTRQY